MANPDNEVGKCLPKKDMVIVGVNYTCREKECIIEDTNKIYHRSQIYYTL